jgi:hypothetical protein
MSKLSQIVVDHAKSFIQPFPESPTTRLQVIPRENLSPRETQLFWRYQGHFPQEFTKAIIDLLPENFEFVSYDHLTNTLEVK